MRWYRLERATCCCLINLYREQFILCLRLIRIACRLRDVLVCVKARFKIYYLETTLLLQVLLRNTSFQSEVSMQLHKLSHLVVIEFCGFQYCFDTRWFCRGGFYRVSEFYDWIKMILILNSSVPFLFIIYFLSNPGNRTKVRKYTLSIQFEFLLHVIFYFSITFERTFRFSDVERSDKFFLCWSWKCSNK